MKTRLLIADDHQDHQNLLMLALTARDPDLDVCFASTGDELLHLVRHEHFDCVVLDYYLGNERADHLIAEAGADLIGTPVVVVSSCREQAVAIASFQSKGVSNFVPKEQAIAGEALWEAIRAALDSERTLEADRRKARRRERELIRLSETDPLTGLMNRRGLERVLGSHRGRKDARTTAACILIDIDHFKQINDTHGHEGGDIALRRLSDLLRSCVAPSDRVVRWGGEEFLVVRSSDDLAAAWSWTERFRRTVEGTTFKVGGSEVSITISAGVCTVPSKQLCIDMIALADQAMYLAKGDGRNRVCTWDMVRVRSLAESVGIEPGLSLEQRWRVLIDLLAPTLGPTQLTHITTHCQAVMGLARLVARRLTAEESFVDRVGLAALLHDIGKAAIPEQLLQKPGELTTDECWMMDTHAAQGAAIAEALGAGPEIVAGVANHHRWYSRSSGSSLPLPGRVDIDSIVGAADALVAMTSQRPYRSAVSMIEATGELVSSSGRQFEPATVRAVQGLAHGLLAA